MSAIVDIQRLGAPPWPTFDPFLFCVHHRDRYPAGNDAMGPDASLGGRRIGMDFEGKDGWSMYHGDVVPGFPRHPHRGFETVTIAREGYIDHSDSLGATARFGRGDVQWMTAGNGVVHSEMFPLVRRDGENPTELFQIWLNLAAKDKEAPAYFTMLWNETIPRIAEGGVDVAVVAGTLGDLRAPSPPPSSWAARPEAEVVIWTARLERGATWTMPASGSETTNRTIYFFGGERLRIDDREVEAGHLVRVRADQTIEIANVGGALAELLVLQGRPIGEPVVHYGPFVMSSPAGIKQAVLDYQRTEYGGWPWDSDGPVHSREDGRFAIHADGRRETP